MIISWHGSDNLIINGNLEDIITVGPPANFANVTESVAYGNLEVETTFIHGGNSAAKLTAGVLRGCLISLGATVVSEVEHEISFWTAGDGVNSGGYELYDVSHGSYITGSIIDTNVIAGAYSKVSIMLTPSEGCTVIRLDLWCPETQGGIAYFDDISVYRMSTSNFKVLAENGWQVIQEKPSSDRLTAGGQLDHCVGIPSIIGGIDVFPMEWHYTLWCNEVELNTLRTFYAKQPPWDLFDFYDVDGGEYLIENGDGVYFDELGIPRNRTPIITSYGIGPLFEVPIVLRRRLP